MNNNKGAPSDNDDKVDEDAIEAQFNEDYAREMERVEKKMNDGDSVVTNDPSVPSSVGSFLDRATVTSVKSNSTNNSSKMQVDGVVVGVDENHEAVADGTDDIVQGQDEIMPSPNMNEDGTVPLPEQPQPPPQQQQEQQDGGNPLARTVVAEGGGGTAVAAAASLAPTLLPNDIACERGGLNTSHPGNLQYLKTMQEQTPIYQNLKLPTSRKRFVAELLGRLKAHGHRFVERHKTNRCEYCQLKKRKKNDKLQLPCFCDWNEIDDRKAKKKITTGFRDLPRRPQQAGQAVKQRAQHHTATAMASVAVGGGGGSSGNIAVTQETASPQENGHQFAPHQDPPAHQDGPEVAATA